jgi:sugar lactone lactonase YvrE
VRQTSSRYPGAGQPSAAAGWKITQVVSPSPLFGSNGMRLGPDGWLYVAQVFGSQITAINPASGEQKIISPRGGEIVSPDDLDFDSRGVMYVTEYLNRRVTARMPNGEVRIISDQVPGANGITVHKDRLFIDECRTGGRLLELFPDGRTPRLMADGLAMPNACAVGPDGLLYFPEVLSGDIWRVPLDGGERERFISGLATPPALKFDNRGALLVLESHTGDVTRIDLRSRQKTRVATIETGLDNLAIAPDDRIFVSSFAHGTVWEVAPNGRQRVLEPTGLIGPWGLTWSGGGLFIADGPSLMRPGDDGAPRRVAWVGDAGFPGIVRDVCAGTEGMLYLTTTVGGVAAFHPESHGSEALASGLDHPNGVARSPRGSVVVVESGAGRVVEIVRTGETKVVAGGLNFPTGLAIGDDGACYVSETGGHRVVRIDGGGVETIADGLDSPQGIAIRGDAVIVLDAGSRQLIEIALKDGRRQVLASNLPVGSGGGLAPKPLPGIPGIFPGPFVPFAGVAAAPDGRIYIAGDADGSVIALEPIAN